MKVELIPREKALRRLKEEMACLLMECAIRWQVSTGGSFSPEEIVNCCYLASKEVDEVFEVSSQLNEARRAKAQHN